MKGPRHRLFWPAAAALLFLAALSWSWLSRRFVYGEGHPERPILLFLACCALAWLVFCLAVVRLEADGHAPLRLILAAALAARLVLLPSNLILENDPYRYVLDGQITLRGENPYLLSPSRRIEWRGAGGQTLSGPAQTTLDRISYPEIPTVYPPAAQLAFAVGAWFSGWDWQGQRWIFLLVDFGVIALLAAFHRIRRGPPAAALLYAWNPLVLKEVANSAHLDVLVAAFLAAAFLALVRDASDLRPGWAAVSGAAFGLAAMSKIYPAILFPAFFVNLWRRRGAAAATAFAATAATVTAALIAPFAVDGFEPMLSGLGVYVREWRMNEGLFSVLELIFPQPRIAAALAAAAVAVLLPALRRESGLSDLVLQVQWILLAWFLLIPSPFPWYAVPLAALAALSPRTPPARATAALSGVVFLYYLSFYIEYQGIDPGWWTAVRLTEHALIIGAVVFFVRWDGRSGDGGFRRLR